MDKTALKEQVLQSYNWRIEELRIARTLATNATDKDTQQYLCRVWLVMLYAHCDGFVKEAGKLYLEHIKNNNTQHYYAHIPWLLQKGKLLKDFIRTSDNSYKSLQHNLEQGFEIDAEFFFKESGINNKYMRFLCDWILQINSVPLPTVLGTKALTRNQIAHGEAMVETTVDVELCKQLHDATTKFLDALQDAIFI